jgi:iron complex outermembrane receptor protein
VAHLSSVLSAHDEAAPHGVRVRALEGQVIGQSVGVGERELFAVDEVPAAPGRRFYRNAGRSSVRGFEASARTALSPALAGRLAYGYVSARFNEFAVGDDIFDGNRIPGIAPHRLEASLRAGRGVWFGELRVETRGEVPANDANDASASGYTLVELRAGASAVRAGSLRLSPFVAITNLTNVRYASSVVVNAFGGRYFEPGPDRGGYVGLSLSWNAER